MPIYEYVCKDCGHKFDSIRTINNADTPIQCKQCASSHTSRVMSVCFSQSDGKSTLSGSGCSGCSGGSCASCHH